MAPAIGSPPASRTVPVTITCSFAAGESAQAESPQASVRATGMARSDERKGRRPGLWAGVRSGMVVLGVNESVGITSAQQRRTRLPGGAAWALLNGRRWPGFDLHTSPSRAQDGGRV